ncbi:MAG: PfkB family carbohydrate kinase [Promethearchaeota archaeon]
MVKKHNNYDVTLDTLKLIKSKLKSLEHLFNSKSCFLGFDGYVDSLYDLVQERINKKEWLRMESMRTFGELALNVSGSSANVERVLKKRIFGGFAPNTSRALSAFNVKIYLVAALGYPTLSEHYKQGLNVKFFPIANPGETVALEFNDGKIMITDFENIYNINWDSLMVRVPQDQLIEIINNSNILGFGHWALVPSLNDIWNNLIKNILPNINDLNKKLFFVDIADIKKRKVEDIIEMGKILQKVNEHIPVILCANDQEAKKLSEVFLKVEIIDTSKRNFKDFVELGKKLNNVLKLSAFVIHSPHFATISTLDEHFWVTEAYTSRPKFTTGAGDHFHSGTILGLSCGLTPAEAILIGNALAAIFVRTGNSPNFSLLMKFIYRYEEFLEDDITDFP